MEYKSMNQMLRDLHKDFKEACFSIEIKSFEYARNQSVKKKKTFTSYFIENISSSVDKEIELIHSEYKEKKECEKYKRKKSTEESINRAVRIPIELAKGIEYVCKERNISKKQFISQSLSKKER